MTTSRRDESLVLLKFDGHKMKMQVCQAHFDSNNNPTDIQKLEEWIQAPADYGPIEEAIRYEGWQLVCWRKDGSAIVDTMPVSVSWRNV